MFAWVSKIVFNAAVSVIRVYATPQLSFRSAATSLNPSRCNFRDYKIKQWIKSQQHTPILGIHLPGASGPKAQSFD